MSFIQPLGFCRNAAADVPRPGYALVLVDPNIVDTTQTSAHLGSFIRRGVVNHDHLDVTAGGLGASDGPRHEVRATSGGDNNADLWV